MTRIDIGFNKIHRAEDLYELSYLFFPQKSAKQLRASFIAIFIEIRNHDPQRIRDTAYLSTRYQIPMASICKARAKMRKLGLIELRSGLWRFSSRFCKSLENLARKIGNQIERPPYKEAAKKDLFLLDLAKA